MVPGDFRQDSSSSAEAWKRAVYIRPPRHFAVEMMPACKQGTGNSYPMRIHPIVKTANATGVTDDYVVHRRWSDCLWFQEELERTYARMAKQKRAALLEGKPYRSSASMYTLDAASFESLPTGPDPHSIPTDVHDLLPKLNKKGSLFRVSQATIDQRSREFSALILALMGENVPHLIKELRASRTIHDFFGYWRRDHDAAVKAGRPPRVRPQNSMTPSVYSLAHSASTPTINLIDNLPPPMPDQEERPPLPSPSMPLSPPHSFLMPGRSRGSSINSPNFSRPLSAAAASVPQGPAELACDPPASAPANYNTNMASQQSLFLSTSSSLSPSLLSSRSEYFNSNVAMVDNSTSNYNPNQHSPLRSASILEPLPEDRELSPKTSQEFESSSTESDYERPRPPMRRTRTASVYGQANRSCRIIDDEILAMSEPEMPCGSFDFHRKSVETDLPPFSPFFSIATSKSNVKPGIVGIKRIRVELDPCVLPRKPARQLGTHADDSTTLQEKQSFDWECRFFHDRLLCGSRHTPSSGSLDTGLVQYGFLDGATKVAIGGSRRASTAPESVPEESYLESGEFLFDAYFEYEPTTIRRRPSAPLGHLSTSTSGSGSSDHLSSMFNARRLSTATVSTNASSFDASGSPDADGMLSIKAAHEGTGIIVALRMPRSVSLDDIRQRLAERFSGHENIPLDQSTFKLVHALPSEAQTGQRRRTNSMSSVGVFERAQSEDVVSERDWERIVSTVRGKVMLRVLS